MTSDDAFTDDDLTNAEDRMRQAAGNLRIVYTTEAILELGDRRWNAALEAATRAIEPLALVDTPPGYTISRSAVLDRLASLRKPVTP